MRKGREIIGLPVIDLATGKEVGIVVDLVCDPQTHRLTHLLLEGSGVKPKQKVVSFQEVAAVGDDAVTLNSSKDSDDLPPENGVKVKEKAGFLVITPEGKNLGTFEDVVVEVPGGRLLGYEISAGIVDDLISGRSVIEPLHVLNWGEEAVIVNSGGESYAVSDL
ncbi:MAG: PRC-barrel domain containing protein [Thermoanaerobacterales bacterium 50_218]|nr:MAG: PRC-barrel domain containing protein [Thermoanaerobacterales bacterium 50_218]